MILIVFMSGNKFINIEFVAAGIGLQQRKFKHVMDWNLGGFVAIFEDE